MTDFELLVLGAFMGCFISMIFILIGVCIGKFDKSDKKQPDGDSDVRIYTPVHDRDNRGVDRHPSAEEMKIVIEYFMVGATNYEKKVLSAALDKIKEGNE